MMKLLMGTHTEIREFLINYLEGRQPPLKAWQFRFHLFMCPDCKEYLKRYNSSVKLARNFLTDPPPEALVNLTMKFVKEHQEAEEQPAGSGGGH